MDIFQFVSSSFNASYLNTILLIVIAWFARRQLAKYDEQTKVVGDLLTNHEKRITIVETKLEVGD